MRNGQNVEGARPAGSDVGRNVVFRGAVHEPPLAANVRSVEHVTQEGRMRYAATWFVFAALGCAATGPTADPGLAGGPPSEAETDPPVESGSGGPEGQPSGPVYVQPGAPGEASERLTADEMAALAVPGHSPADVRFMRGMIPHHAQALEMVALMPGRTSNPTLLRLGKRIEISQRDEIALMERWLRDRGEAAPGGDDAMDHGGGGHGALMPGMLTPEQMAELAALEGSAFDRRFLELMIGHHRGALVMVRELFGTPGGGQESWAYQFASDVEADQEMEIRRMRRLLEDIP